MGTKKGTDYPEDLAELIFILSLARPHEGESVYKLIDYIESKHEVVRQCAPDGQLLALTISVGEDPKSLFTAHLDTVHRDDGANLIVYDHVKQVIRSGDDTPLGADDGAGIWLLLQMVGAGVKGVYQFPMGEERGGIGSKGVAQYHDEWLSGFERAIAFDRKGTHSVITHQGWGRCCSNRFASRLAEELNCGDYFFAPDDTGLYTDTAEYTYIIRECTNVSCGYYNEHTARECLDVEFLTTLRDRLLVINWEALPSVRLPGESDDRQELGAGSTYWANEEGLPYLAMLSHWELLQLVEQGNSSDVVDLIMELVDAL